MVWIVTDSLQGFEQHFKTEEEALACAEDILQDHRDCAAENREWSGEEGGIKVYKLAYRAEVSKEFKDDDGRDCIDYELKEQS